MSPQTAYQWGQLILIVLSVLSVLGGLFMKFVWPRVSKVWSASKARSKAKNELPEKLDALIATHSAAIQTINNVAKDVAILTSITRARADANPHEAYFEFDNTGLMVSLNKTYCRWVNLQDKEILQKGYKNTIHWKDRERVIAQIEDAITECRSLSIQYHLLDDTLVESTMTPIPEGVMPCDRFVGVIRKVKEDAERISHE